MFTTESDDVNITENQDEENVSSEPSDTVVEYILNCNNKGKCGRQKIFSIGSKRRPRKLYCLEDGPVILNSLIEKFNAVVEAFNSQNLKKWKEAMQIEYNSLIKVAA